MAEDGKSLTCTDAFGKMCADIRAIVSEKECAGRFGKMFYPTRRNPAIILTHGNGLISQVDVLFEEVGLDENGKILLPERVVTYRAD